MVLKETEGVREMQSFSSPKNVVIIENRMEENTRKGLRNPTDTIPIMINF